MLVLLCLSHGRIPSLISGLLCSTEKCCFHCLSLLSCHGKTNENNTAHQFSLFQCCSSVHPTTAQQSNSTWTHLFGILSCFHYLTSAYTFYTFSGRWMTRCCNNKCFEQTNLNRLLVNRHFMDLRFIWCNKYVCQFHSFVKFLVMVIAIITDNEYT